MSDPRHVAGPSPGEFELIRWVRERSAGNSRVVQGIGDDAAVLDLAVGSRLVVTTDMLMEGRHFTLEEAGPVAVGHKALAVNLSDLAAMAARPVAGVVAVALPRRIASDVVQGLHEGLDALARTFGVAMVGGDTNAWDGPLVLSLTLLGETTDRGPVYRSGARPGDVILITGPLGGSLLGRHLRPVPRVREALTLHEAVPIRSMIDVSDGLASDLGHILEESGGLGAWIDAEAVPIHEDAEALSRRDGRTALDHALNDGEDFELCLTLDPEAARLVTSSAPPGVRLFQIGEVTAEPGLWLLDGSGGRSPLVASGFDHLRDRSTGSES
ncbi:MAG: thiamine-monophosphate kinase [Isosphaeraceae bacterium]